MLISWPSRSKRFFPYFSRRVVSLKKALILPPIVQYVSTGYCSIRVRDTSISRRITLTKALNVAAGIIFLSINPIITQPPGERNDYGSELWVGRALDTRQVAKSDYKVSKLFLFEKIKVINASSFFLKFLYRFTPINQNISNFLISLLLLTFQFLNF